MKTAITIFVLLLLTGFSIYQTSAINNLKKKDAEITTAISKTINHSDADEDIEHEEIEVAEYMGKLQIYTTKLYFAGINKNITLAEFYLHETEEVMEKLADANVVDEGIKVSELMKIHGESTIESMQKKVKKEGLVNFNAHYTNLINACNACHIQSEHEFIKIIQPQNNPFVNQDFTAKL
jgi:hypothetical protein